MKLVQKFADLSIKIKIIGGFLFAAWMLFVGFAVNYYGLNTVGNSVDSILEHSREASQVNEIRALVNNEWLFYTNYSLTHKQESLTVAKTTGQAIAGKARSLREVVSADEAQAIDQFITTHEKFVHDGQAIAALYVGGDTIGGNVAMKKWNAAGAYMIGALDAMEANANLAMEGVMDQANSARRMTTTVAIILGISSVVVAIGVGLFLARIISRGINTIAGAMNQIATGDLTAEVKATSTDEIGQMSQSYQRMQGYLQEMAGAAQEIAGGNLTVKVQPKSEKDALGNAFSQMITSLSRLIGQVRSVADSLAGVNEHISRAAEQTGQATQQIATTSQQVARGASDQSVSLQGIMQSLEQLTTAINQIANGAQEQTRGVENTVGKVNQVSSASSQAKGNAQVAAEGARQAGESAQKGARMAQNTVEGMEKIKITLSVVSKRITDLGERSNEIGKIVATIDDIATQTNLLALNAAIEAARAGEQGRGFAVVADEVRKLAERSSAATNEIAELISGIQKGMTEAVKAMEDGTKEVENGYKLANEAGESLDDILATVQTVGSQVEQIAGTAKELDALSLEMVKVTEGVSSVVEQNTAASEQMAANASQVSKSVESVAGVAEENSAASEQLSAAAQQMSAEVQEVVASAKSLTELSDELMKSMVVFRLNGVEDKLAAAKN